MSSNTIKINSPVAQDYGKFSAGVTKTYTIPAMDVNSITPFYVTATITSDNAEIVTVIVKAPSGGRYVTGEGIVASGGGNVCAASGRKSYYDTPVVASGILIRLS